VRESGEALKKVNKGKGFGKITKDRESRKAK